MCYHYHCFFNCEKKIFFEWLKITSKFVDDIIIAFKSKKNSKRQKIAFMKSLTSFWQVFPFN